MTLGATHVLADLMKSHVTPEFLNNFDQESWEHAKLHQSSQMNWVTCLFLFSELWIISPLKWSCKTHPQNYTVWRGLATSFSGSVDNENEELFIKKG